MPASHPPTPENPSQESQLTQRWKSPWRLLIILVATIFSVELLVMSALHFLKIPAIVEIVIDSMALVLLLMPVLLRTVVYPMRSKIDALAQAEQSFEKPKASLSTASMNAQRP